LVRAFAHGLTYADSHLRFGVAVNLQDEVTVRKFFDVKADGGEIAWVLDEGANIAGIIHRVGVSPSEAEIALIVRADLRRRGIGEFLSRQILSRAARQGFKAIGASIFWNNRAALRLVSKLGCTLGETSTWGGEITFDLDRVVPTFEIGAS
jgi:GNAT superfamily N-acetyltransferase